MSLPRYSQRPLPPYRHLPGQTPHPERDPEGHAFGRSETVPEGWSAESWRGNDLYLHGVDLFNLGYWWEAHAAWEALWQASGDERAREFLQGLIQIAAALVQLRAGRPEGARKLANKGVSKLVGLPGAARFMGVEVGPFAQAVEEFFGIGESGGPVTRDENAPPRIVLF